MQVSKMEKIFRFKEILLQQVLMHITPWP